MVELSMILPTYNERENIAKTVSDLNHFFDARKMVVEIIVVDDSSPDGTADEVRRLQKDTANLVLLADNPKQGIGKALERGYDAAKGEWLLSMDADWAFETDEIAKFLDKRAQGFDFITASKYSQGAVYRTKSFDEVLKQFVSRGGTFYIRAVSGLALHDFTSNFRLLRKEVWKAIRPKDNENFFLVEMLVQAHRKGFRIAEVPVTLSPRNFGVSKTRLWKQSVKFFAKTTRLLFDRK
jgi:dolichol-phosphate mannosyltransferase